MRVVESRTVAIRKMKTRRMREAAGSRRWVLLVLAALICQQRKRKPKPQERKICRTRACRTSALKAFTQVSEGKFQGARLFAAYSNPRHPDSKIISIRLPLFLRQTAFSSEGGQQRRLPKGENHHEI
jgi:hypothetical protein